jgi:hypothetical protein
MAASRATGSDLGRPKIDWEEAFTYYASLPDPERSYQSVATQFDVSVRTVENHGRRDNWATRLQTIKATAAQEADALLSQARLEQSRKIVQLIEATLVGYAQKLRQGEIRMAPSDLEKLTRLLHQLQSELRSDITHPDHNPIAPRPEQSTSRSAVHIADVVAALAGALEPLGLQPIDPRNHPTDSRTATQSPSRGST